MHTVLIAGLGEESWQALRAAFVGFEDAPTFVSVGFAQRQQLIKDLLSGQAGPDLSEPLPEAGGAVLVFLAGFDGRESSHFIDQTRRYYGQDVIFASLTPTNAGWSLEHLAAELVAERDEMRRRAKLQAEAGPA